MIETNLNVKLKLHNGNSQLAYKGIAMKNVTGIIVFTIHLKPCKSYQMFTGFVHTSLCFSMIQN